jgi:hypothetical protein
MNQMKKIVVRKTESVKLTTSASTLYGGTCRPPIFAVAVVFA